MFFAVPAIILKALSKFFVFKSGNLIFAIFSISLFVIDPTICRLGSEAPFFILVALTNNTEAGGVFSIDVYDLS